MAIISLIIFAVFAGGFIYENRENPKAAIIMSAIGLVLLLVGIANGVS